MASPPAPVLGARDLAMFLGGIAGTLLFIYARSLGAGFGWDDMDYLHVAADFVAGDEPLSRNVFRLHQEHMMPLSRLVFATTLATLGAEAWPIRLVNLIFHGLGGLAMALLAARLVRSTGAGIASGIAYVLPAAFSSMWIWIPSGGGVPMGLAATAGLCALVLTQDRLRRSLFLILAFLSSAVACLSENTALFFLASPILLHAVSRARSRRLPDFPLVALVLAPGIATTAVFLTQYGHTQGFTLAAVPAALLHVGFLLASAPLRFLFPAFLLTFTAPGETRVLLFASAYGLLLLGLVAIATLALPGARRYALELAAITSGPLVWISIVGFARATTPYSDLWFQERYYFPLLLPASLIAGMLFRGFIHDWLPTQPRSVRVLARTILLVMLGAYALSQRSALNARIPYTTFSSHTARFDALRDVLRQMRHPEKLVIPDTAIAFSDLHNSRLSTRLLVSLAGPSLRTSFDIGPALLPPREAQRLRSALQPLALNPDPQLRLSVDEHGALVQSESGLADFTVAPHENRVTGGFHHWERRYRWLGRSGTVRLPASGSTLIAQVGAPLTTIRQAMPSITAIVLRVHIRAASGPAYELPPISLTNDAAVSYEVEVPTGLQSPANTELFVDLRADTVWRPSLVLGSDDSRELSARIYRVGIVPRGQGH